MAQTTLLIFRRVRKIAKIVSYLRHVYLSVRPYALPHGTTRLPLDGFSRNLIFEYFFFFSEICRENLSSVKIWQELRVRYMKACVHL